MNNAKLSVTLLVAVVLACDPGGSDEPAPSTTSGGTSPAGSSSTSEPSSADDSNGTSDDSDGTSDDSDGADGSTGSDDTTGGSPGENPSCEGLEPLCADESCCETLDVPGGPMQMGRGEIGNDVCPDPNFTCFSNELPEHDTMVDGFALDKYAVTVGRFRNFVNHWNDDNWRPTDGQGAHPAIESSGWQASWSDRLAGSLTTGLSCGFDSTWTSEPGENEAKPVNCLSWYQAQAFCIWDGGRLPTEAEFEYAAAGGDEDRVYPWGSAEPDETRAVFDPFRNASLVEAVGTRPDGAGRWGHLDLAGNVGEWVFDCYDSSFYETAAASEPNPVNLPSGDVVPCVAEGAAIEDLRSVRSGGAETYTRLRSAGRDVETGTDSLDSVGFRCARS